MVHHFRHDEYLHIKPVLIVCAIVILLIAGGAVAIYYATKPKDTDFSKFYSNTKNPAIEDADDTDGTDGTDDSKCNANAVLASSD